MWKSSHVIVALLIAPVLALIAYFATDYVVGERPRAAQAGDAYALLAKSSCRYASGLCELENGDVRLTLRSHNGGPEGTVLQLESQHALSAAHVALVTQAGNAPAPVPMQRLDDGARLWRHAFASLLPDATLRLVVVVGESRYFTEVPTTFVTRPVTLSR